MAKPKVAKGTRIDKGCIDAAKAALSHFTDDELRDYVSSVNNRASEYEDVGRQDAVNRAIQDINKQEMEILLSQAATKAKDALKLEKKTRKIDDGVKLESFMHMTAENKDDNMQTAPYKSRHQLFNQSLGRLTSEQYDLFLAGEYDKEIGAHLDGRRSNNPEVVAIGDILKEYPEFRNLKMIQSTALQPHEIAADRKLKTTYDQSRVLNANQSAITQAESSSKVNQELSKEYFIKRRIDTLDLKKTFGNTSGAYDLDGTPNMARINEIVGKTYNNIVHGASQIFIKSNVVRDWEAVQRSKRMFYHAKDWSSWIDFNNEFGTGSLFSALLKDIQSSGQSIGLAETFGSNPDAMYNALRHAYIDKNPEVPKSKLYYNDQLYQNIKGKDPTVYAPTLNNIKNALTTLGTMNRLGKLALQSISDIGQVGALAQRFGYSHWGNVFDGMFHIFGLMPEESRIRYAKCLKMDLDVNMGYLGKFADANNFGDVTSKVTNTFFKITAMNALDHGNILSSGSMLIRGIGHDSGLKFSELNRQTRSQFEKFNVTSDEWDALRSKIKDDMFAPDIVDELSSAELKDLWNKSDKLTPLTDYRDTIYNKVYGMFNMAKENTILNPGAFESVITGGNLASPGSAPGILLSMFRQFKQYPIAYFRRIWNGGMKDFDTYQAKLMYGFNLTAATMMFSYLSNILEAYASGKTPPDFSQMNASEKFKFLLKMSIPGAGIFWKVMDPQNQNKHLVTNLITSPSIDLSSDALATGFALLNGDLKGAKRNVKDFVKHANPISSIAFADPFFQQLMGDKPYLEPGQRPLF
jgi:hypothetical protein